MSGTTEKTEMKWNYEIHGDCGPPFTTPEPGTLDDMAIFQAKLLDHTTQVAELEEIYRNNTSTSPLISPFAGSDDSPISSETIARLGDPSTFGSGALPDENSNFWAAHPKDINSRQDDDHVAAASLPIVWDYETPRPDGQARECAQWHQLIGGYEKPLTEDATMDPRLGDGSSDAFRALQSEDNPDDQSPPQPPSAELTTDDPLLLTPVSSPHSSASKPTSPSRKFARNRLHKCQHPGCTRMYDRVSRAQACFNKHQDQKPHGCEGGCGKTECDMSFVSVEQLGLHEKAPCPHCKKDISKRNMAKHRDSCYGQSTSAAPGPSRTTRSSTRNRRTGNAIPGAGLQASQVAENES